LSEILTTRTTEHQASTQGEVFPPIHLSLSIGSVDFQISIVNGHVHTSQNAVSDSPKNILSKGMDSWSFPVNDSSKPEMKKVESQSETEKLQKENSQVESEVFNTNDGWEFLSDHPRLRWKTENGVLHCNYSNGSVKTTWNKIEEIARMDGEKRKEAIKRLLGSLNTSNKQSAVSLMVRFVAEGKIKRPPKKPAAEKRVKAVDVPKMITPTDPRKLPKVK
jgi:hypothetical protein